MFNPVMVGACGNDIIDSNNADYVIGKIGQEKIADSTVTMVLIGTCTHSRRHVDWDIKASLRQGAAYKPNGLFGIILPSAGHSAHLPPGLAANWNASGNCYAGYYRAPRSAAGLALWIEHAFLARETRMHLIKNSAQTMKYNSECRVCNVTHSQRTQPRFRFL